MSHLNFFRSAVALSSFCMLCYTASAQNSDKDVDAKANSQSHYKPWPQIAVKDIAKSWRVWEGISTNAENDKDTRFSEFNKQLPLINLLIRGGDQGKIVIYAGDDTRFTKALSREEFGTTVIKKLNSSTHITKYIIKEDSIITNTGQVSVRIIGLAPVTIIIAPDGTKKEQPLFWIYYPDSRSFLAETPVVGNDSWYDVFEQRYFTGTVERVDK